MFENKFDLKELQRDKLKVIKSNSIEELEELSIKYSSIYFNPDNIKETKDDIIWIIEDNIKKYNINRNIENLSKTQEGCIYLFKKLVETFEEVTGEKIKYDK